jgi:hypothetical protein
MEPGGFEPPEKPASLSKNKGTRTRARTSIGANPKSLKRGRLMDISRLMYSLRFHRPALAAVVGTQDAARLATFAEKILEVLDKHPATQDRRLEVVEGVVRLAESSEGGEA